MFTMVSGLECEDLRVECLIHHSLPTTVEGDLYIRFFVLLRIGE